MSGPEVLIFEAAFLHNFRLLQNISAPCALMPVIKADAYGHSAPLIARICEARFTEAEVPYLVVARVSEARALRAEGITRRLLVLSQFSVEDFVAQDWPTATDLAVHETHDVTLVAGIPPARRAGLAVHFNINTGMNRLGFALGPTLAAELCAATERLRSSGIAVTGLMTHLARGEEDPALLSNRQESRFKDFVAELKARWPVDAGPFPLWIHGANSPGMVKHVAGAPAGFNATRPGLHLWGAVPSKKEMAELDLKPVAEVRAHMRQMFWVEAGEGVGYGHRFICPRRTLIGTVPLGYADGVSRKLSRRYADPKSLGFFVEKTKVPVAGTVSMDLTTVDLTDHPLAPRWSEALARGEGPIAEVQWLGALQRCEVIADFLGTISYEVLCAMGHRLPRRWVKAE